MIEKDLFDFVVKSGKIDLSQIQAEFEMKQKEDLVKDKHPFAITYNEKKNVYITYLPDSSKPQGRRQIKRKNYEDLIDIVAKYIEDGGVVTIADLFHEFTERKLERGDIKKATVTRYQQVFDRHFVATGWDKREIKRISPEEFSDWIEDEVARCNLSSKGLLSLTGLIKGIIQRARKHKLITYHYSMISEDVDAKPRKVYKKPEEQTFTEYELPILINYLMSHRDTQNLCLLFMVLSGIRTGEMVGLRFDDFVSETSAEIKRAETKYRDKSGKWVYELDNPKTMAGFRTIFIPGEYGWIIEELRRINPNSEYLASKKNGERMHTEYLRRRLYKICRDLDFDKEKSPHKMRKTFCSILLDGGFDKNLIISIMGHTDINTSENFYHYDRKSASKKQDMIDNVVEFKAG